MPEFYCAGKSINSHPYGRPGDYPVLPTTSELPAELPAHCPDKRAKLP